MLDIYFVATEVFENAVYPQSALLSDHQRLVIMTAKTKVHL